MRTVYKPIKFPRDQKAHNHLIEWWYFNGNLKDKKGNRYAFMDTLFKVGISKLGIPLISSLPSKMPFKNFYFAHSIISDIENNKSYPNIHEAVVVSKDSFSKPLLFINYADLVPINGYENSTIEEISPFNFKIKNENIELSLESLKKPMLESGKGFTDVCGKKSFYYSLTNLKVSGKIKVNNKIIDVVGKAWMDHQWTNAAAYYEDKWNWFCIQLDNNTEIMCNEYITTKGDRSYLIDVMHPNGKHESLKQIKMIPSKKSYKIFPLEWEIEIPQKLVKLKISAPIKDQEIKMGPVNYWEGPINVKGIFDGRKVKGSGFMELIGNASPYGKFSVEHLQEILKKIF